MRGSAILRRRAAFNLPDLVGDLEGGRGGLLSCSGFSLLKHGGGKIDLETTAILPAYNYFFMARYLM